MSVLHDSASCAGGADDDAAAALRDDAAAALRDDAAAALGDDAAAALGDGGALVLWDGDALVLGLCAVPPHAANASTSTMNAIHPLTPRTTLVLLAFARSLTPAASLDD
jgi:hypothetical protein